jgi:hypothetical protein
MAAITSAVVGAVGVGAGIAGQVAQSKRAKAQQEADAAARAQGSQLQLGQKSQAQQALERQSQAQYNNATNLINQQEAQLQSLDPLRQAALAQQQGILDGSAFQATDAERQGLQDLRQALLDQSAYDIGLATDAGLQKATSNAAVRGLRGQALGQTRAQVVNQGQEDYGRQLQALNAQYQQALLQTPYQRVQAQAQAAQNGLTYQDQLRQQALNNRLTAQSPYLLQQMQQERLATGRQIGGPATQIAGNPGIAGGLAAIGQGFASGVGAYKAINEAQGLRNQVSPVQQTSIYAGNPYSASSNQYQLPYYNQDMFKVNV